MSFHILYESVIQSKLCCFCGACVAVCPHDCIVFREKGPQLVNPCEECGKCMDACPGFGAPLAEITDSVFHRKLTAEEEKRGFGNVINDRNLVSTDPVFLQKGYNGGKVTALLDYLLKKNKIDGAIVASSGDAAPYPCFCWPEIAQNRSALLQCSGSKYMFSPNLMPLKEIAHDSRFRSIAFVGVGCHAMGLRKLQFLGGSYRPLIEKISYVFGLFCSGPLLSPEDFMRMVAKFCRTNVEDIDAIEFHRIIEDSKFNVEYSARLKNKEIRSRKIWINDLFFMMRLLDQWPRCGMCMDYSAEFADISFGAAHIISRTQTGEQLIREAVADGIFTVPPEDFLGKDFQKNAIDTDEKMIRAKKTFNLKRIKKNIRKQIPAPDFGMNIKKT